MPRFADLQKRNAANDDFAEVQLTSSEEVMVSDVRSHLSPAQVVEQKLGAVLRRDAAFLSRDTLVYGRKATKPAAPRPKKPR